MANTRMLKLLLCLGLAGGVMACSDDNDPLDFKPQEPEKPHGVTEVSYCATDFANYSLSTYYLWNEEIAKDMGRLDPDTTKHPIQVVEEIRYKDEKGEDIDRWTMLHPNMLSVIDQGNTTTFGFGLALGKFSNTGKYFFIINYVCAGSPAEKAGLKRGDVILTMDGKDITKSNYSTVFEGGTINFGLGELREDGMIHKTQEIDLTAIEMYENPIMFTKTFDCGGKKVGYLWFNEFQAKTNEQLIEIVKDFKREGISELILDMRYNGGGDVSTEFILASMFAPESYVNSGGIYQQEVYNKKQGGVQQVPFYTELQYAYYNNGQQVVKTASTFGANLGLTKIYALISPNTASASESIIVGLLAFDEIEVEIIGTQSHGKFCTGAIMFTTDVYKKVPESIKDWGIYVMINRFTDKNGNNPCMPRGLVPDVELQDNPLDGYPMGDERETLLHEALVRAGKTDIPTGRSLRGVSFLKNLDALPFNARFGMRIDDRKMNTLNIQK